MEGMKIERNLGDGQTAPDGRISLEGVGCLGCCAMAPVVVVNSEIHGRMNRVTFMKLVDALAPVEEES
jgi:NADH-quinone oxidoreductase subunit E